MRIMFGRSLFTHIRFFSSNIRFCSSKAPQKNGLSQRWHNAFGKYLLFTNTWTSGALMVAGDILEQEIEYYRNLIPRRYDWERLGRMFITGLLLGPLHHYFYGWMDRILPKRSMGSITQKILLDQFIMSPACIVTMFYTMSTLEGKSANESVLELKQKFVEVYAVDWCVWPPTQFINFYYIPVKYQVLYINAVTMLYNVFLSYIKHREPTSLTSTYSIQESKQNKEYEKLTHKEI